MECLNTGVLNSVKEDFRLARLVIALSGLWSKARVFGKAQGRCYYGREKYSARLRETGTAEESVEGRFSIQDRRPWIDVLEEQIDQIIQ